uniref:tubulin polyglutamylase TTLL11-like isoform X2 n=1 Tax=Ciona intestinalis TaxID=7719 RepID=UPI000EF43CE2|nr:tubulin polyglutamylase TTLL11-like isoform X2 [Ciona intestinalis]|eukprot:XP_026695664.1 tubulin polyglutamylase TTLL11-like isoform X2 [Ciona intestinalis]
MNKTWRFNLDEAGSARDNLRNMISERKNWSEITGSNDDGPDIQNIIYWDGCNFKWRKYNKFQLQNLAVVNRIPGFDNIALKVNTLLALRTAEELNPKLKEYYPETWMFPMEKEKFVSDTATDTEDDFYLWKPDKGTGGVGIDMFNKNQHEKVGYLSESAVVQGGLVKCCTADYEEPTQEKDWDPYSHITNINLNQNSPNMDFGEEGTLRKYECLIKLLKSEGHNTEEVHNDIIQLTVDVILATIPQLLVWRDTVAVPPNVKCFQVVGFDIMLTSDLKPLLLEMNSAPVFCSYLEVTTNGKYERVHNIALHEKNCAVLDCVLQLITEDTVHPALKLVYSSENDQNIFERPSTSNNLSILNQIAKIFNFFKSKDTLTMATDSWQLFAKLILQGLGIDNVEDFMVDVVMEYRGYYKEEKHQFVEADYEKSLTFDGFVEAIRRVGKRMKMPLKEICNHAIEQFQQL